MRSQRWLIVNQDVAIRDTRIRCPECGRDKWFSTDWLGRVMEGCGCGLEWQRPDEKGPRRRLHEQRRDWEAELRKSVRQAMRPANPQAHQRGNGSRPGLARNDFGRNGRSAS